jgi:hypothetical protein
MTQEQRDALIAAIERLSEADQSALQSFAEFLLSRSGHSPVPLLSVPVPAEIPEPEAIPRPDAERVVAAVKRLSKSYFMLDKKTMLGATSDLVTQHVLHGREASEVIDQLEEVFRQQYQALKGGEADV